MKHIAAVAIGLFIVSGSAFAADGDQSVDDWVTGMLRRIPFGTMGAIDKKEFQTGVHAYLDGLISHYRMINENPRKRAEAAGDTERVRLIDERTKRQIVEATDYVRATEAGMMHTLDPDGRGDVGRREARRILTRLAENADTNADGILDRYESVLAEAAFAKGRDLASPGEVRRLVVELDR